MTISRRGFILGALPIIAAPAIVRAASLMPVRMWRENRRLLTVTHVVTSKAIPGLEASMDGGLTWQAVKGAAHAENNVFEVPGDARFVRPVFHAFNAGDVFSMSVRRAA